MPRAGGRRSFLRTSRPTSWWTFVSLQRFLAQKRLRRLGSRGCAIRLRPRVQEPPSSLSGHKMDSVNVDRKGGFIGKGNYSSFIKRGCRGSTSVGQSSRLLLDVFPGSKKRWNFKTSHKSSTLKPIYRLSKFQNGDSESSHSLSETGGLVSINRFEGCLPTRPHSTVTPEISKIRVSRTVLPVASFAVRAKHSSTGVDESLGSNNGDSTLIRDIHIPLYRRPPYQGEKRLQSFTRPQEVCKHSCSCRFCHQYKEVRINTNTGLSLCRRSFPNQSGHSDVAGGSLSSSAIGTSQISPRTYGHCVGLSTDLRSDGFNVRSSPVRKVSNEAHSGISEDPLEARHRSSIQEDSFESGVLPSSVLVASSPQHFQGLSLDPTGSGCHPDNGRLTSGLGRFHPQPLDSGIMDSVRSVSPHQCARTQGNISFLKGFRGHACKEGSPLSMRQYDSLFLHSQDGRDSVHSSAAPLIRDSHMVHSEGHCPTRSLPTRGGQLSRGSPKSNANRSQRMVSTSINSRCFIRPMGQAKTRSVCIQTEYKAPEILQSLSGRGNGTSSGRFGDAMDRSDSLRFSSKRAHTLSPGESTEGTDQVHDPNSPCLDQEGVVPDSSGPVGISTNQITPTESVPAPSNTRSTGQDTQTSPTRPFQSGGLANHRQTLESQGFSSEVVTTMLARRGDSTYKKYNQCWRAYHSWCEQRNENSFSASAVVILQFLQSLLDAGRACSTLRVYASAISAFHFGVHGIPVGQLPAVSRFLAGSARIRPPPVTLPGWSLQPVLQALCTGPWEPLETVDLKFLTLKTVFLLAVTSARRVSELQALSVDQGFFRFLTPDVLFLRTNVDFMPKCKTEFHRAQDIRLESFHPNPQTEASKSLHKMCPVRVLSAYVNRTKDIRKGQQLLVSYKKGSQGFPVTKKRISAWIVECIRLCYQQQNIDPPKELRAHGTRAQAASWAAFAGVDASKICRAAVWSNLHTFCKHYRLEQMWSDRGISTDILTSASQNMS